jgi:FkbM family methyltransferase
MTRLNHLLSKTLLHYFWEEFQVRYRFKYVLPRITETELEGIRLDLSSLSLKCRNRILMGIYEAHERRLCEEFLQADDSVVELGAGIGFIGLVCQKKIGIKQYSSFEADPGTLQILHSNYRLNGLQAAAWNLALGPQDGFLKLDVTSDFWEHSVIDPTHARPESAALTVPSASLESILQRAAPESNALVIDVEGAERFLDPIRIPARIDKLIMELHPKVLGSEATYALIASLIKSGFYVAREEDSTFVFLRRKL